jgi:hypothetical protein
MKTKEKPHTNRNKTNRHIEVKIVEKAVEEYLEENKEIKLAKEAMSRSQSIKERRIAPLLKRASYLRIH